MAKSGWNGEWYVNYGCIEGTPSDKTRSWAEALKFSFVAAGGGPWYRVPFRRLQAGDRIWVKIPGAGFVGVARVVADPVPLRQFRVTTSAGDVPAASVLSIGHYVRDHINDLTMCDYFCPRNVARCGLGFGGYQRARSGRLPEYGVSPRHSHVGPDGEAAQATVSWVRGVTGRSAVVFEE